jgi:hypothetical protein
MDATTVAKAGYVRYTNAKPLSFRLYETASWQLPSAAYNRMLSLYDDSGSSTLTPLFCRITGFDSFQQLPFSDNK